MTWRTNAYVRRGVYLLLASVLAIVVTVVWAIHTRSGAERVLGLTLGQLSIPIEVAAVEGTIADGLALSDIRTKSNGVDIQIQSLRVEFDLVGLLRKQLIFQDLEVMDILIDIIDYQPAAADIASSSSTLANDFYAPLDIEFRRLNVRKVHLLQQAQETQTVINSVELAGNWTGNTLKLTRLVVHSPFGKLDLAAEMSTVYPYALSIDANSHVDLGTLPGLSVSSQVRGNLEALRVQSIVNTPYPLSVDGSVSHLLSEPTLDLDLTTKGFELARLEPALPSLTIDGTLQLDGSISQLGVTGLLTSSLPKIGSVRLDLNGKIRDSVVHIAQAKMALLDSDADSIVRASGELRLGGTTPEADLSIDWTGLTWPLAGGQILSAPQGNARVNGTLDDYFAEVTSKLGTTDYPGGTIQLEATGDRYSIDIPRISLKALDGDISGRSSLSWKDQLEMTAVLSGRSLNPGHVLPKWPGRMDFQFKGRGVSSDSGLVADIGTLTGTGKLRGFPVELDVAGQLTPSALEIKRLKLNSGDTRASASGSLSDTLDFSWKIDSPDLGSLMPDLGGELVATGTLGGTRETPRVNFTATGSALVYEDLHIELLEASGDVATATTDNGHSIVTIKGLRFKDYSAKRITVDANGVLPRHTVAIEVDDSLGNTQGVIKGELFAPDGYQFELQELVIQPIELGTWMLSKPVSGRLAQANAEMNEACLIQNLASVCLSFAVDPESVRTAVSVSDAPLSLFAHLLPSTITTSGTLSGGGGLSINSRRESSGQLEFITSPVQFRSKLRDDTTESTVQFAPSTLRVSIEETNVAGIDVEMPLISGGGIELTGTLQADNQHLLDRSVTGSALINLPSLAFVADYIPDIAQIRGSTRGAIDLSGSIRNPRVLGELALEQAQIDLDRPAISLTDVSLQIVGEKDNRLSLSAHAQSGGGDLKIEGAVRFTKEGAQGDFDVAGSDFQVMNLQEAMVWASPEVKISYKGGVLNLAGTVDVPKASVAIDSLPEGAIRISKDQIIIGQQQPSSALNLQIDANLGLTLGDDVNIDAFGLQSKLLGSITIHEQSSKPTTATGELALSGGKYRAYGQNLDITTGRLVYVGGPITEPGIDLRASRKATQDIEVGISARGTLDEPKFSIFSTPAMGESEQLAYLIFGRPINTGAASENSLVTRAALALSVQEGQAFTQKLATELGLDQINLESEDPSDLSQASLVIGKYLSPRLFVSYGIGLLEPVSTLKLEYALSSKWHLITESSSAQSSADAQYTLER